MIAAVSGRKSRDSREISPGWLIPNSPATASQPSSRFRIAIGTPIPLLRLPGVFPVRNRTAKIAAAISFVVVLPTEPVTAASRKPACRRFSDASF